MRFPLTLGNVFFGGRLGGLVCNKQGNLETHGSSKERQLVSRKKYISTGSRRSLCLFFSLAVEGVLWINLYWNLGLGWRGYIHSFIQQVFITIPLWPSTELRAENTLGTRCLSTLNFQCNGDKC